MLRDKALIPLSHHHQHALALCVRIERALQKGPVNLEPWQSEIEQIVRGEITIHFAAEEKDVFPLASRVPSLLSLVDELITEHAALRELFDKAALRSMTQSDLLRFAQSLSSHIRKEERQLFETMQKELTPESLARLGDALNQSLSGAVQACALPTNQVIGRKP